MRSTQVFAMLAMVAASVSGLSIGRVSNQVSHRRHVGGVHESVVHARGARKIAPAEDSSDMVKRNNTVPHRKRGLNQRRCAPKTTTGLPQTTPTPSASPAASTSSDAPTNSDAPTSSDAPTTTPEPKPTTSKTKPATSQAEPTTSSKAKYVKPSQSQAPTKTSTSAQPTATNDDDTGSSSESTYTGEATFYGTGLGACGTTSKDTDYIAAASELLYDGFQGYSGGDPNGNPICGKKVTANYQGKSVTVTIVDRCVACAKYDLDFSPSAFTQLADQALGRLRGMTWKFD